MKAVEALIGRNYEQEKFEKAYQSKRAEFIAVYGRRRVGKTYLIRYFFSKKDCLYFQLTGIYKAAAKVQLKEFIKEVANTFYTSKVKLEAPKSWMEAFEILTELIEKQDPNKTQVLFFDELPWMAMRSSKLLAALEYYWNRHWSNMPQLKLIVCGSATAWIINKIIKNKGGLHNRVTLRLPLESFTLVETQAFLKHEGIKYDAMQLLQLYMCIGGIPYYLTMLDKGLSATQNINRLCFQKKGTLLDEFTLLMSSLFDQSAVYEQLLELIASKREGMLREDIEEKIKIKGGDLSKKLAELEQTGFIAAFMPWGRSKKGKYYKIVDEYTLFYFHWIAPRALQRVINEIDNKFWEEQSQSAAWRAWSGYAFEAVCFKHISKLKKALKIPEGASAMTWRYLSKKLDNLDQGVQIDLLFDRGDGIINLCEIKYSNKLFVIDKEYAKKLKDKIEIYQKITKTSKQLFISFVTTLGLAPGVYVDELVTSQAMLQDFLIG